MDYQAISLITFVATIVCLIIGGIFYLVRNRVYRGIFPRTVKANKSFRRRDTAVFIGKKIIHRITALKNAVGSFRHRKDYSKFKLRRSFAKSFSNISEFDDRFPKEYILVIKALAQIFNFENSEILKILDKLTTRSVLKNEKLFFDGNIEQIYIVKSGSVELFYSDETHKNLSLRVIGAGEPICTSTFFLEQIITKNGNIKPYKLSATALETSIVCSFSIEVLKSIFCRDFEALIRLIQLTVLRLQNVIFQTLCQSFGLRLDLLINDCDYEVLLEPENMNFENSEIQPEMVIQTIYINRYEIPSALLNFSKCPNEAFKERCVFEILKLFKPDDPSTYEEIRKMLIEDGFCYDFEAGQIIDDEGSNDGALYFILKGSVNSILKIQNSISQNNRQINLTENQLFDLFSVLSGTKTKFNFIACQDSQIFMIPQNLLRRISTLHPIILQKLSLVFLGLISSFMKNLNFGLEFESYETGSQIYCEGSAAENIYIIQHGRLQLVSENKYGEKIILGEFSKNDFVGMDEAFEKKRHIATLIAIRETEVVSCRISIFDFIQRFCPEVMISIANMLSRKIGSLNDQIYRSRPQISPYSTVALVPASPNIPIKNFAIELNSALNLITPCTFVDNYSFSSQLHPAISKFRYLELINQLESDNYMILWICDHDFTEWTQQSILHADLILIVSCIEENYSPNLLEIKINRMNNLSTPQHLVLMHREDRFTPPENTASWLSCRKWICDYYHIRCSNKIYRNNEIYMEYFYSPAYQSPKLTSDFSRIARRITNTSVGLVLGGGGAKGLSHVGVICALEKAGIPIDMIGGCSIGAFVGALYSSSIDSTYVMRRTQNFAEYGMSIIKNLLDLTLPIISFLTGSTFNHELISIFENTKIEDFLIPYFCVSTDISSFQLKVHSCGTVWRACRASMSLLNLVPPICDPNNNHLLIDGGYLNILPFDVMFRKGAKHIIAVDVSRKSSQCIGDYGDELSGWRVLWNKIWPFGKKLMIPSMNDIHDNLCFINCMKLLSDAQNTPNVLYLSPPIQQYHGLRFQHAKEIMKIGLEYTEAKLKELDFIGNQNYEILFKNQDFEYCPSKTSYLETDETFLISLKTDYRSDSSPFECFKDFSRSQIESDDNKYEEEAESNLE